MKKILVIALLVFCALGICQDVTQPIAPSMSNQDLITIGLSILLGISEALALIPSLKSNGIVHFVIMLCKAILNKKETPK